VETDSRVTQIFRQTVALGEAKARDSNMLRRTRATVLRLRICCKTQIISSFRLCSDLVTAFIHYFLISKWLTLSSATLELASICLAAVINCTNSRLSIDVFFATAIDMFCSVGHICYLIWFDLSFFSPHNWMAFVRLDKRHVTLCCSQLMDSGSRQIAEDGDWQRQRPGCNSQRVHFIFHRWSCGSKTVVTVGPRCHHLYQIRRLGHIGSQFFVRKDIQT